MAKQTELVAVEEALPESNGEEVSSLIRLALEQKVDVEVLERLVALQERVTERDAQVAMAEALSAFQAECPTIPRARTAKVTKQGVYQYEYQFAPLEEIVKAIRPLLTKHHLAFTHDAEIADGTVKITCTIQHVAGATRQATFTGPVDTSGGKNPIQQVASARSYGRRYSLIDVLGLTTEDDDDGVTAGGKPEETITDAQVADLNALIEEVGADREKFMKWQGIESLEEILVSDYSRLVKALERKRERKP